MAKVRHHHRGSGWCDRLQERRWPNPYVDRVTRSRPDWKIARTHPDGVASMALHKILVPTFIVSHRGDACDVTPAIDAEKLRSLLITAKCADVAFLDGGDAPQSGPCDAFSQHGFFRNRRGRSKNHR
jgi:hypothetical protein